MKTKQVTSTFFAGAPKRAIQSHVDQMVHVDRIDRLIYPDWFAGLEHPELGNVGLAEYNASELVIWFAPGQENVIGGMQIYNYLIENSLLSTCVGLADLIEIQKKGICLFRENWKSQTITGWRSVAHDHNGDLRVPALCVYGNELILQWNWLNHNWTANNPTLRFVNK